MRDDEVIASVQRHEWWLVRLGNDLLWARLTVSVSGIASVLDSDGQLLRYDSEDTARAALMDAEYFSFEGLGEEDALSFGLRLEDIKPPRGESDETLLRHMIVKLAEND